MTLVGDTDDTPTGYVLVPTSRDEFGELDDWRLVPMEAAADWDARSWRPRP